MYVYVYDRRKRNVNMQSCHIMCVEDVSCYSLYVGCGLSTFCVEGVVLLYSFVVDVVLFVYVKDVVLLCSCV